MNEVTNKNFKEIYPRLEHTLKTADFIGIDSEFTGIKVSDAKRSLFHSMQERYDIERQNVQPYIIIQFGITAFQRILDKNEYSAEIFNFFLLPRSLPSKNRQLLWQIASLEFLTSHGFNFNKVAYHGISYLDESEQAMLQQQLQKNTLPLSINEYISFMEENDLKDHSNQVAEWLKTATDESSFKIKTPTPVMQYFMHKELRNRFPNVWTISGDYLVIVMKVSPDARKVLEKEEGSILENVLYESYIGFSKVFNLLVTLKKPIIAHNAMLDLMFMYQQFYKPLPQKYVDFKENLHKLFPTIYDTKFLSYEMREFLHVKEKWKINSLSGIYSYFMDEQGKHLMLGSPLVKLHCEINSNEPAADTNFMKYHTAGWDSYFTGFIFIKMSHVFAVKKNGQGLIPRYFTNMELINSLKVFANCITVIRGNVAYLKLDGPDPESKRPNWLYVKTSKSITAAQIADKMSTFGIVDVKQFTPKRVLVAVSNHKSARNILQHFKQNKELYVVPYSPIRHSPSIQLILWGSIVISGGVVAWMLHQKLQKSS